jgi:hypothetical protein
MLTATRGFNYGPDGTRVDAGDTIDDSALPKRDRDFLVREGVLEKVEQDTKALEVDATDAAVDASAPGVDA